MPVLRTSTGRARAWLRLATMQKRLSDYVRWLVAQGDALLPDYYEPHALLRSDHEAALIVGLLGSLNVVDCNICDVREENLDSQQGVIDFSLYLRSQSQRGSRGGDGGGCGSVNDDCDAASMATESSGDPDRRGNAAGGGDLAAVLDQKNYVEELNRHLTYVVYLIRSRKQSELKVPKNTLRINFQIPRQRS